MVRIYSVETDDMNTTKHERSTRDLVRAAVSGWLGTALEFMDFQLYSLGAALVFHAAVPASGQRF